MTVRPGAVPGTTPIGGTGDLAGNLTDSAGVPWAGRTLTAQPFAGDDGGRDPRLEEALARFAAGEAGLADVVAAWRDTRVLVPVVAVLGEGEDLVPAEGDKSADMALATLVGRDGSRALPAFTAVAALAAWDAAARPVPVEAARAALAAVGEDCDVVVLDPAGPVTCVLPRPVVHAVARGLPWRPPHEDPEVVAAVAAACADVPAHRCGPAPGSGAGLSVVLGLPPGLSEEAARDAAGRVGARLGADPVVAERADALVIRLEPLAAP